MHRIWYKVFGALIVAPWFVIPRPAPSTRLADKVQAEAEVGARVNLRQADARASQAATLASDPWRRTNRGWERASRWNQSEPKRQPHAIHRIHPWTFACLQFLLCLAALLAIDRRANRSDSD